MQFKQSEPGNSVRIALSIPKDAALRLRQLVAEGNVALRSLGIKAVQIDGDSVISLKIRGHDVPMCVSREAEKYGTHYEAAGTSSISTVTNKCNFSGLAIGILTPRGSGDGINCDRNNSLDINLEGPSTSAFARQQLQHHQSKQQQQCRLQIERNISEDETEYPKRNETNIQKQQQRNNVCPNSTTNGHSNSSETISKNQQQAGIVDPPAFVPTAPAIFKSPNTVCPMEGKVPALPLPLSQVGRNNVREFPFESMRQARVLQGRDNGLNNGIMSGLPTELNVDTASVSGTTLLQSQQSSQNQLVCGQPPNMALKVIKNPLNDEIISVEDTPLKSQFLQPPPPPYPGLGSALANSAGSQTIKQTVQNYLPNPAGPGRSVNLATGNNINNISISSPLLVNLLQNDGSSATNQIKLQSSPSPQQILQQNSIPTVSPLRSDNVLCAPSPSTNGNTHQSKCLQQQLLISASNSSIYTQPLQQQQMRFQAHQQQLSPQQTAVLRQQQLQRQQLLQPTPSVMPPQRFAHHHLQHQFQHQQQHTQGQQVVNPLVQQQIRHGRPNPQHQQQPRHLGLPQSQQISCIGAEGMSPASQSPSSSQHSLHSPLLASQQTIISPSAPPNQSPQVVKQHLQIHHQNTHIQHQNEQQKQQIIRQSVASPSLNSSNPCPATTPHIPPSSFVTTNGSASTALPPPPDYNQVTVGASATSHWPPLNKPMDSVTKSSFQEFTRYQMQYNLQQQQLSNQCNSQQLSLLSGVQTTEGLDVSPRFSTTVGLVDHSGNTTLVDPLITLSDIEELTKTDLDALLPTLSCDLDSNLSIDDKKELESLLQDAKDLDLDLIEQNLSEVGVDVDVDVVDVVDVNADTELLSDDLTDAENANLDLNLNLSLNQMQLDLQPQEQQFISPQNISTDLPTDSLREEQHQQQLVQTSGQQIQQQNSSQQRQQHVSQHHQTQLTQEMTQQRQQIQQQQQHIHLPHQRQLLQQIPQHQQHQYQQLFISGETTSYKQQQQHQPVQRNFNNNNDNAFLRPTSACSATSSSTHRQFLINPLTGELEPSLSDDSETEAEQETQQLLSALSDLNGNVNLLLPNSALFSEDETCNSFITNAVPKAHRSDTVMLGIGSDTEQSRDSIKSNKSNRSKKIKIIGRKNNLVCNNLNPVEMEAGSKSASLSPPSGSPLPIEATTTASSKKPRAKQNLLRQKLQQGIRERKKEAPGNLTKPKRERPKLEGKTKTAITEQQIGSSFSITPSSVARVASISETSNEKIRLRLKLERSMLVSPAYKADVNFIQPPETLETSTPSERISSPVTQMPDGNEEPRIQQHQQPERPQKQQIDHQVQQKQQKQLQNQQMVNQQVQQNAQQYKQQQHQVSNNVLQSQQTKQLDKHHQMHRPHHQQQHLHHQQQKHQLHLQRSQQQQHGKNHQQDRHKLQQQYQQQQQQQYQHRQQQQHQRQQEQQTVQQQNRQMQQQQLMLHPSPTNFTPAHSGSVTVPPAPDEPRVPPLHISLRGGKSSIVIRTSRKERRKPLVGGDVDTASSDLKSKQLKHNYIGVAKDEQDQQQPLEEAECKQIKASSIYNGNPVTSSENNNVHIISKVVVATSGPTTPVSDTSSAPLPTPSLSGRNGLTISTVSSTDSTSHFVPLVGSTNVGTLPQIVSPPKMSTSNTIVSVNCGGNSTITRVANHMILKNALKASPLSSSLPSPKQLAVSVSLNVSAGKPLSKNQKPPSYRAAVQQLQLQKQQKQIAQTTLSLAKQATMGTTTLLVGETVIDRLSIEKKNIGIKERIICGEKCNTSDETGGVSEPTKVTEVILCQQRQQQQCGNPLSAEEQGEMKIKAEATNSITMTNTASVATVLTAAGLRSSPSSSGSGTPGHGNNGTGEDSGIESMDALSEKSPNQTLLSCSPGQHLSSDKTKSTISALEIPISTPVRPLEIPNNESASKGKGNTQASESNKTEIISTDKNAIAIADDEIEKALAKMEGLQNFAGDIELDLVISENDKAVDINGEPVPLSGKFNNADDLIKNLTEAGDADVKTPDDSAIEHAGKIVIDTNKVKNEIITEEIKNVECSMEDIKLNVPNASTSVVELKKSVNSSAKASTELAHKQVYVKVEKIPASAIAASKQHSIPTVVKVNERIITSALSDEIEKGQHVLAPISIEIPTLSNTEPPRIRTRASSRMESPMVDAVKQYPSVFNIESDSGEAHSCASNNSSSKKHMITTRVTHEKIDNISSKVNTTILGALNKRKRNESESTNSTEGEGDRKRPCTGAPLITEGDVHTKESAADISSTHSYMTSLGSEIVAKKFEESSDSDEPLIEVAGKVRNSKAVNNSICGGNTLPNSSALAIVISPPDTENNNSLLNDKIIRNNRTHSQQDLPSKSVSVLALSQTIAAEAGAGATISNTNSTTSVTIRKHTLSGAVASTGTAIENIMNQPNKNLSGVTTIASRSTTTSVAFASNIVHSTRGTCNAVSTANTNGINNSNSSKVICGSNVSGSTLNNNTNSPEEKIGTRRSVRASVAANKIIYGRGYATTTHVIDQRSAAQGRISHVSDSTAEARRKTRSAVIGESSLIEGRRRRGSRDFK